MDCASFSDVGVSHTIFLATAALLNLTSELVSRIIVSRAYLQYIKHMSHDMISNNVSF